MWRRRNENEYELGKCLRLAFESLLASAFEETKKVEETNYYRYVRNNYFI